MADRPQDAPRHAGHVVRRTLLRRNIAIDAETAQLVAAAVQAALRAGAPVRPSASRCSDPSPLGCRARLTLVTRSLRRTEGGPFKNHRV
jgi:hypothetical protein